MLDEAATEKNYHSTRQSLTKMRKENEIIFSCFM